jgi:translation initiation factor RLI1
MVINLMEYQEEVVSESKQYINLENYDFPVFYYKHNKAQFYFKRLCLEVGKMCHIVGEKKTGKTLFMRSLCGLEYPQDKPMNTIFLNYDITYKPDIVQCNNETILLKEYIKLKKITNHKMFEMAPFMNMKMIDIPEEKKQVLGFLLSLKKDSLFYMIDISIENVSKETLKKMVDVFRIFCEKNNKIGLITTATESTDLISQTDHVYHLKKNMENEYYGEQLV